MKRFRLLGPLGITVLLAALQCDGTPTAVPVTVIASGGPGGSVPIFATTSLTQLKALLRITGSTGNCPTTPTPVDECWPNIDPPSSSLLVAFPSPGGSHPPLPVTAKFDGGRVTLHEAFSGGGANAAAGAPAHLELATLRLRDLPKAVIGVVKEGFDGPVWHGGAGIVDLREPLPPVTDLAALISSLTIARDEAFADSRLRLNLTSPASYTGIERVGVVRWNDNSLGCPGITPTDHVPVAGYVLFLAQVGIFPASELEYHIAGDHAVFCRFSAGATAG